MTAFRKAQRTKARLRLGISGPSGAGKTYSALLIAFGLGGKVALIDTENGSGDLYAHLGDYDVLTVSAPFTVEKYIAGIKAAEEAGYETVVIDSLSHAWSGDGGLLDQQGKIADSGRGNSYTAWRTITPKHNSLVETMLQSKCHVIATMRSKTEYVIEKTSNGKDAPKKVGLAPIQRDGMEYEFTVFLDISIDHTASASKDRTSLLDSTYFRPSVDTGKQLLAWLNAGSEPVASPSSATVAGGAAPKTAPPAPPKAAPVAPPAKAEEVPFPPEESAPTPPPASKEKTTNFEFLKTMAGHKTRLGRSTYYDILGANGFEHANEITKRDAQIAIHKELSQAVATEVA